MILTCFDVIYLFKIFSSVLDGFAVAYIYPIDDILMRGSVEVLEPR